MTLMDLKKAIENNSISDAPLIFKYTDDKFLVNQYIKEIAKIRRLKISNISSIYDISQDDDLFDSEPQFIYVCDCDTFSEDLQIDDINIIIICKNVAENVKVDYIEFSKPLNWQIEDFVKMRISGLDEVQIKWLCEISKYDIFRLDNECKKFEIFSPQEQKIIFDMINTDNGFSDMNSLTIFNFTNAIIKKDLATIKAVLSDLKNIDIEGSGLITIFSKQFRNIIDIQLNLKASAESLNMTSKQYNAIKYSCGKYSNQQLIDVYTFITDLDRRLKLGDYQFVSNTRENNNKLWLQLKMLRMRLISEYY